MSNNSFVNLAAASAFTIYTFGYLIPGTGFAIYLLGNIAKHEAIRAKDFDILDRELELVYGMQRGVPIDDSTPLPVTSSLSPPTLVGGILPTDAPRL